MATKVSQYMLATIPGCCVISDWLVSLDRSERRNQALELHLRARDA